MSLMFTFRWHPGGVYRKLVRKLCQIFGNAGCRSMLSMCLCMWPYWKKLADKKSSLKRSPQVSLLNMTFRFFSRFSNDWIARDLFGATVGPLKRWSGSIGTCWGMRYQDKLVLALNLGPATWRYGVHTSPQDGWECQQSKSLRPILLVILKLAFFNMNTRRSLCNDKHSNYTIVKVDGATPKWWLNQGPW